MLHPGRPLDRLVEVAWSARESVQLDRRQLPALLAQAAHLDNGEDDTANNDDRAKDFRHVGEM